MQMECNEGRTIEIGTGLTTDEFAQVPNSLQAEDERVKHDRKLLDINT